VIQLLVLLVRRIQLLVLHTQPPSPSTDDVTTGSKAPWSSSAWLDVEAVGVVPGGDVRLRP
jgi:hypothetical protein